jgi:hypothetical protein
MSISINFSLAKRLVIDTAKSKYSITVDKRLCLLFWTSKIRLDTNVYLHNLTNMNGLFEAIANFMVI